MVENIICIFLLLIPGLYMVVSGIKDLSAGRITLEKVTLCGFSKTVYAGLKILASLVFWLPILFILAAQTRIPDRIGISNSFQRKIPGIFRPLMMISFLFLIFYVAFELMASSKLLYGAEERDPYKEKMANLSADQRRSLERFLQEVDLKRPYEEIFRKIHKLLIHARFSADAEVLAALEKKFTEIYRDDAPERFEDFVNKYMKYDEANPVDFFPSEE